MYVPIKHFDINQEYHQVFWITNVEYRESHQGKPFVFVQARDVSGSINGVIFDANRHNFKNIKFIRIPAQIKLYQGEKQFVANIKDTTIQHDDPDNIEDFIHGPNDNVLKVYKHELDKYIEIIEDPDYRDLLHNSIHRVGLLDSMLAAPYGLRGPLGHRGGLLIHATYLVRTSLGLADIFHDVELPINKSLIIVGSIFRNIGYISTTHHNHGYWQPKNSYHLIGVRQASFMFATQICMTTETDLRIILPQEKKLTLLNICRSHTTKEAKSVEGKLVLQAENLVNGMKMGEFDIRSSKIGEDDWNQEGLFIGHHKQSETSRRPNDHI